jgi:hypothetical protein
MLDDLTTLRHIAEDLETDLRLTTTERDWFVQLGCEQDEIILVLEKKLKMQGMIIWCLVAAWVFVWLPLLLGFVLR